MGLGAQVADDVAQALQAAQLSQAEGDELRPAAHHAESLALLVLLSLGVEFMSGKQVEKLPGRLWYYGPRLGSPVFERFGAKVILSDTEVSSRLNLKFYGTVVKGTRVMMKLKFALACLIRRVLSKP